MSLDRPSELGGLSVTVMGLGLFGGGSAVARFLAQREARVTVTDLRSAEELAPSIAALEGADVELVLGEHRTRDFANADLVVANPAVPPNSSYLALARENGVPITSEIALFLERCPAPIGAVTGTQGKSSTCHLAHGLLEHAGFRTYLGGNIGSSLLDRVDDMNPDDRVVLELSSYQLEALATDDRAATLSANVRAVCVTNVLSDHLERHGSRAAYVRAKRSILDLRPDVALLPGDARELRDWNAPGALRVDVLPAPPTEARASTTGRRMWIEEGDFRSEEEVLARVADLRLPGRFQRINALFALGLAHALGASTASLSDGLAHIRGLPHRCEDLGLAAGHRVWDNGVSTTPDSTVAAMRSLEPGYCLLAGGQLKELDLEELAGEARNAARVIAFGKGADALCDAFAHESLECACATTLDEAVRRAFEVMEPGEELLFSPAGASFDAYSNFRERALAFRRAVTRCTGQSLSI